MIFTEILKALSERTGAAGAVMIDNDGEVVASWASGGLDMELVGAHFEIILDAVNEAASLHGGPAGSVAITTSSSNIAILPIKEGYCLVLVMDRSKRHRKVMFEAARAIEEIEKEMG